VTFQALGKSTAVAALMISAIGLTGCGESSSEKATKKVCSATSEITAQIKKLQSLPISSSFVAEATKSVEAIGASVKDIEAAAPDLPTAQKEEVNAADKAFQTEVATITKDVAEATKSSNLEAALKAAGPKIDASLSKLAAEYKKAYEKLKCS
jgi:hypothetical protein